MPQLFLISFFLFLFSFFAIGINSVWQEAHESIFSISGIILIIFLAFKRKIKFNFIDVFFIIFLILSVLHIFTKEYEYINHIITGIIYVSYGWIAKKKSEIYNTQENIKIACAIAVTISGFSLLIQIYQILGIAWKYDPWMMPVPLGQDTRPSANIGQPNILASIYITSLAVLFWASKEKLLNIKILFVFAIFIAYGIALTQSRVGYLSLIALSAIFLLQRNSRWLQKIFFPFVFLCSLVAAELISTSTGVQRELAENLNNGRFAIWQDSLVWIKNAPLLGYGVNGTAKASWMFAESNLFSNQSLSHAHNLFLDLLIWFGIPIGGLLIVAVVATGLYLLYKAIKANHIFPILVLTPFTLHSMVELPLYYANTLILFGFLTGLACQALNIEGQYCAIQSNIYKIYILAITVIAAFFGWENIKLELDRVEQRNYYYGIGQAEWKASDKVYLADIAYDFQSLLVLRPGDTWLQEQIHTAEKVSMYITSPRLYQHIIEFYDGKDEEKFQFWLSKGIHRLSKDEAKKLKEKYKPQENINP